MRSIGLWRAPAVLSLCLCLASWLSACAPDLGKCDLQLAKTIVYAPDGTPFYAGQAQVFQSCAGAFCHAAGATGAGRLGAPHNADFDTVPLGASPSAHDITVLRNGIERVRELAPSFYDRVDNGSMPPGGVGKRAPLMWLDASGAPSTTAVPLVTTSAGKEMLRNWLACDAPIVATTDPAAPQTFGDTVPAKSTTIAPSFASIYGVVLGGCTACHNADANNPYKAQQALDFTTMDAAYTTLVGPDAFANGSCKMRGKLVVAGDCAGSLLYQKLLPAAQAPAGVCGSAMPLGGQAISKAALDAVCNWIKAGAKQ